MLFFAQPTSFGWQPLCVLNRWMPAYPRSGVFLGFLTLLGLEPLGRDRQILSPKPTTKRLPAFLDFITILSVSGFALARMVEQFMRGLLF